MSKVTFSLVGGQPFPVYAQALDSEPDILVLFYSEQTERIAQNIEQCIKQKLPKTTVSKVLVDATNLKESSFTFNAYANAWLKPGNEVTVNLSGGTKPWSMQLLNIFAGKDNARCVFIDQNNYIWDMASYERHKFDHTDISLDDKFALYGVQVSQRTSIDVYDAQDLKAMCDVERLYRFHSKCFNDIVSKIEQDDKQGIFTGTYSSSNMLCHINRTGKDRFECSFEKANTAHRVKLVIASPHASQLMLCSGWFELKVAKLLSQWYGARTVWLNTIINYPHSTDPINEIDVIVETTNDKLLFVECKTQVYAPTDVDKFNDVTKSYGGQGSKRIFFTHWSMKNVAQLKCDALRIPHYVFSEVARDQLSIQSFFNALDKYMGTINAR